MYQLFYKGLVMSAFSFRNIKVFLKLIKKIARSIFLNYYNLLCN